MDIKTKGFSMPDGNTHIFIPPAPTETDRGGITAKICLFRESIKERMKMDIKTKGFSMPDGNTHIFIPPAPTETDRGGITAKPRTTEVAEVVVDSGTGKGYIGTDHTLKAKGQAADSEAVGIAISEKADRIISSASGENVILTDSAEATLQGLKVFGRSMQDGIPSPDAPVPIVSVGDKGSVEVRVEGTNLLNIIDKQENNVKVEKRDEILTISTLETQSHIYMTVNYPIVLEPGTYVFTADKIFDYSFTENGNRIEIRDNLNNTLSLMSELSVKDRSFSITERKSVVLKFFCGYKEANKSYKVKGLRLNRVKKMPYEEYALPQSLTLSTPNGLPGIKVDTNGNYTDSNGQQWVCDKIVEKDGVIGIERHIAKKVLTGLEWWSVDERRNENNGVFFTGMPESGKGNERVLCNRFKWKHTTDIYGTIDTKYHQFRFYAENRTITVDEWKRFVANNNIEVYYQLQKPTFEPLPQSEQDAYKALHTNNPTTVISNDESAHMEVTYVADTKTYVDKKIAEISTAIMQKGI